MLADAEGLVGIPYLWGGRDRAGCDCWGAVCLYFAQTFSIELPALSSIQPMNHADKDDIRAVVAGEARGWDDVPQLGPYAQGDVLLLDRGVGVAVVLADPRRVLLSMPDTGTVIVRIVGIRWGSRIQSAHRHVSMSLP